MESQPSPFEVSTTIDDARVRIFRRLITIPGEIGNMPVDCYVIITRRYVVICDTLLCPKDMAIVMQAIQDALPGRQLLVFNSHADWDHSWGNCYFVGNHAAPIIAHEDCLTRLQSPTAQAELRTFQQRDPLFQQVVLLPPTLTFSSTLTVHGGDLTIQILAAPGHCSDHCALWLPELGLLLAFDAVEQPIPSIDQPQSVPAMLTTLEHFLALRPRHVLCSHSAANPSTIAEHLAYLREIERRVRHVLAGRTQPFTPEELEHAAALLHFPFTDVIAATGGTMPEDSAFYHEAHEQNVRCVLQWLNEATCQHNSII